MSGGDESMTLINNSLADIKRARLPNLRQRFNDYSYNITTDDNVNSVRWFSRSNVSIIALSQKFDFCAFKGDPKLNDIGVNDSCSLHTMSYTSYI